MNNQAPRLGVPDDSVAIEGNKFKSFLVNMTSQSLDRESEVHLRILEYIKNIQLFHNQFLYIHHIKTGKFYHKGFEECLGFRFQELTADFFVRNIHVDDRVTYFNVSKALLSFVTSHAADLVPFESNFHINYRIKNSDDVYVPILRQSSVMILNERHEIEAYLSLCTDMTNILDSIRIRWHMFGPKSEKFPQFLYQYANKKTGIFSDRELEILQLLIEGYSSTEIGEKLFISLNTVNTHRKSLMKKANVKKTVELIAFAREKGYL
ncbi:response regulator transcription factor [Dyadobacter sp. CY261]|uniref:helix-turn-helix transcriptional regulator n=1 Tax=Dyadobacter sp. CY261 TaxID=2907203 RepID=UPI001F3B0916|nr:response regulator transcription factor [Dyadobacter sp. CY261]MCF0072993.1 response regulator transcription factor [Dyadobacter sp. CY261]